MSEATEIREIKCPHCGWVRAWKFAPGGYDAPVALGVKETLQKIAELFNDRSVEDANAWIVMPACPHCEQVYEYNVRTGATR